MSGSPVYVDGELIGALSYRLGPMPKEPIAGVTPIEDILDATRVTTAQPPEDENVARITTPLVASGLAGAVRDWLAPQLEPLGFVLSAGGQSDGAGDSEPFQPGSPIGVASSAVTSPSRARGP